MASISYPQDEVTARLWPYQGGALQILAQATVAVQGLVS